MKIIAKPRMAGKTTELVKLSAENNWYIVSADRPRAVNTFHGIAKELELSIPFPLTFEEFITGQFCAGHPDRPGPGIKGFLIDDVDDLLRLFAKGTPIHAVTLTDLENHDDAADSEQKFDLDKERYDLVNLLMKVNAGIGQDDGCCPICGHPWWRDDKTHEDDCELKLMVDRYKKEKTS